MALVLNRQSNQAGNLNAHPSLSDAYAVQEGLFLKAEANGNGAVKKSSCPDCPGFLIYQEGCEMCPSCGYNRCG